MFKCLKIITVLLLFTYPYNFAAGENYSGEGSDSLKYLNIPERKPDAAPGSFFASLVTGLSIEDREKAVVKEILNGNVPLFSRKLRAITVKKTVNSQNYELVFYTLCDYVAIGSDDDYLYMPMTPSTAQYLADRLDCSLPTKKMVDLIYNNAGIKLRPQPIPPSDKMTTVPVFKQHTDSIKLQITQLGLDRTGDSIIAGHKKDIIISNKIYSNDRNYERVVIYGWHLGINNPIQPMYNGHIASYADYSHGVRLIADTVLLNGDSVEISSILKNPDIEVLLSDEGVISKPYYPPSDFLTSVKTGSIFPEIKLELEQNYPNPFNPSTTIKYTIPTPPASSPLAKGRTEVGFVSLKVYDVLGKEIKTLVNQRQYPGNYSVTFNAAGLPSGVYIYKLQAGNFEMNKKMLILK